MSLSNHTQISEEQFTALQKALSETAIGRSFLKEHLRRNQAHETKQLLKSVQQLEEYMRSRQFPSEFDSVRLNLYEMNEAIARTKKEIARLKTDNATGDHFAAASNELDAIVSSTENATQAILEAAEAIQESAWTLRENPQDASQCDAIDEKATEIFMSCSFQDLTGQRTQKVVQVLHYLEERLDRMIRIWGVEGYELDDDDGSEGVKSMDKRPDAHLLNGPQLDGEGVNQSDIDALLNDPKFDLESADDHTAGNDVPEAAPTDTTPETSQNTAPETTAKASTDPQAASADIIPLAQAETDMEDDLDLFEADAVEDAITDAPAPGQTEGTSKPRSNADPLERLSTGERLALFS